MRTCVRLSPICCGDPHPDDNLADRACHRTTKPACCQDTWHRPTPLSNSRCTTPCDAREHLNRNSSAAAQHLLQGSGVMPSAASCGRSVARSAACASRSPRGGKTSLETCPCRTRRRRSGLRSMRCATVAQRPARGALVARAWRSTRAQMLAQIVRRARHSTRGGRSTLLLGN